MWLLSFLLPTLSPLVEFQTADRILSCYILYSMYAPHPISINPFATVLYAIFVRETNRALEMEKDGGFAKNDQFVYVLWKILKGDGKDVSDRNTSPIPPNHSTAVDPDRTIFPSTRLEASYTPRITRRSVGKRCKHPQLAIQLVRPPLDPINLCSSYT